MAHTVRAVRRRHLQALRKQDRPHGRRLPGVELGDGPHTRVAGGAGGPGEPHAAVGPAEALPGGRRAVARVGDDVAPREDHGRVAAVRHSEHAREDLLAAGGGGRHQEHGELAAHLAREELLAVRGAQRVQDRALDLPQLVHRIVVSRARAPHGVLEQVLALQAQRLPPHAEGGVELVLEGALRLRLRQQRLRQQCALVHQRRARGRVDAGRRAGREPHVDGPAPLLAALREPRAQQALLRHRLRVAAHEPTRGAVRGGRRCRRRGGGTAAARRRRGAAAAAAAAAAAVIQQRLADRHHVFVFRRRHHLSGGGGGGVGGGGGAEQRSGPAAARHGTAGEGRMNGFIASPPRPCSHRPVSDCVID